MNQIKGRGTRTLETAFLLHDSEMLKRWVSENPTIAPLIATLPCWSADKSSAIGGFKFVGVGHRAASYNSVQVAESIGSRARPLVEMMSKFSTQNKGNSRAHDQADRSFVHTHASHHRRHSR